MRSTSWGTALGTFGSQCRGGLFFRFGHEPERRAPITAPPGDFNFLFPRALVTPEGRLVLLWAESSYPSKGNDLEWIPLMLSPKSGIWTSTYSPGRGWDRPRQLLGGSLQWGRQTGSTPVAFGTGTVTVLEAAPAKEAVLDMALVFTSGSQGGSRYVQGSERFAAPTLAVDGQRLHVAFIAGADQG